MLTRALVVALSVLLAACASYDGRGLRPGESGAEQVLAVMGSPALRWTDADGAQQLAYPRGPAGFHTFMVRIGPDGRLRSIENVLDLSHLAQVLPGMSKDQVLRTLGPPDETLTVYFPARDELAWDWRFNEGFPQPMRMIVLFDASAGTVRSTLYQPEAWAGADQAVP
jgi:hypothetical protein